MSWQSVTLTETQSWEVPTGVSQIDVTCVGPGGAGGHANETFGGGGGGGGASHSTSGVPVNEGSYIGVVVGPPGTFAGGSSSFSSWFGGNLGSQVVCWGGWNGDTGIGGEGGTVEANNVSGAMTNFGTPGGSGSPTTSGGNNDAAGSGGTPNGGIGQEVGGDDTGHDGGSGYVTISYEVKIDP